MTASPCRAGRLALIVIVPAVFLAGCDSVPDLVRPSALPYSPDVYAVTAPESLAAGDTTTLWVHTSRACGEVSFRLAPVYRRADRVGYELWGMRLRDAVCPVMERNEQRLATVPVPLPAAGSVAVVFYGGNDSLAVTLTPGPPPPGPEHTVEVERAGAHTPVAGASGIFEQVLYPPDTLAAFVTDAAGTARVTYDCDPTLRMLWLWILDAPYGYGGWASFEPASRFCGRALRTKVLVYGQPSAPSAFGSAVGWRSSAATYSAGSPWWRRPVRMASR